MAIAWIYLLIAGIFEVQWAITMKYTEGFSRFFPSVICVGGMVASVWFLALAQRELPVGTSYAVWVGMGAVGTALLGILWFDEARNLGKLLSLGLVIAGIVGLKLFSSDQV